MNCMTRRRERIQQVVMPKVGDIVAEEMSSRHTPGSTTPTSSTLSGSCAKIKRRSKRRPTKGEVCYIGSGPHGYAMCPKMKNLGSMLCKQKKKDAQDQRMDASTIQLGMVGLRGAIDKQTNNLGNFST